MQTLKLDIEAYLDNELGPEDRRKIKAIIDRNPAARRHFRELEKQKNMLVRWFNQCRVLQ